MRAILALAVALTSGLLYPSIGRADDLSDSLTGLNQMINNGTPRDLELVSAELVVSGGAVLMGGSIAAGEAAAAEEGGFLGVSGMVWSAALLRVAGVVGIYCTIMQKTDFSCVKDAGNIDDTVTGHYFSTIDRMKENFFILKREAQLKLARENPALKKRIISLWKSIPHDLKNQNILLAHAAVVERALKPIPAPVAGGAPVSPSQAGLQK
jgi:hypothetical protein